jgi:hypothetical protein
MPHVSEGMIILSRSLPVKPATFHMPKQQARHFLTRQAQSKLASTHSWAIVKNWTLLKLCILVIPEKKSNRKLLHPVPSLNTQMKPKMELLPAWTSVSVPFYIAFVCAICKECAKISYFDFDLKNNTIYYINISVIKSFWPLRKIVFKHT